MNRDIFALVKGQPNIQLWIYWLSDQDVRAVGLGDEAHEAYSTVSNWQWLI